jgi:hypothetical protein
MTADLPARLLAGEVGRVRRACAVSESYFSPFTK